MYHVFAGENYYPDGGADDYIGNAGTLEGARDMLRLFRQRRRFDWYQITDACMSNVERGVPTDLQENDYD